MRRMARDIEIGDIKKGPWKAEEDEVLINHVRKYGPKDWSSIRSKGLLRRTGKSCRLRWVNKLRPDLKTGVKFSAEEERTVIDLQAEFGNKWAKIATYLQGRTDNDVKNFWSSRQKRLARILHTSPPSSSKSNKQIQTPAFPIIPSLQVPKLKEEAMEMVSFGDVVCPQEQQISFPQFHPLLMESGDLFGRLGGIPSFWEDEFEHSTTHLPILPSFPPQESSHDLEDMGTLIDDFPPMDLFDQIEKIPSPSEWS